VLYTDGISEARADRPLPAAALGDALVEEPVRCHRSAHRRAQELAEERAGARIVEVAEPELERRRAARRGELVHEGLDGEDVQVGTEAAQRRGANRHRLHEVLHDPAPRQRVRRRGVAVDAGLVRQERLGRPRAARRVEVAAGQQVKEGDKLVVLEAMKMEMTLASPLAGVVKEVYVRPKERVDAGDLLIVFQ